MLSIYQKETWFLYLYLINMKPELSVIIVNYNGVHYLKECLDSLRQKLNEVSFEIIIIDNNSKDESCSFIKQNFPEVVLIESKINYGFGKGNNKAVQFAQGDYLLLINNDTIVLDQLQPILETLKSDTSIGVVGINMRNANQEYISAAGVLPSYKSMFQFKKLLDLGTEFQQGNFTKNQYQVGWLVGSFLLLSKKVYQEIDGFDPNYFMYVEDVDFCKKISDKGYKVLFLPKFSYIHFVGFSKIKNEMLVKGYQIYIEKHEKGIKKILLLFLLKINSLVKKAKAVV